MSSDRAPPERPASSPEAQDDEIDPASETGSEPDNTTIDVGRRRTSNIEMLVIEAELVADGHEPDNPAIPVNTETGETFRERIDGTDLVPAWTRPWEQDGGGE